MRLLHTSTLTFAEFHGSDVPPYIIASHRWFAERDEPGYKDVLKRRKLDSPGYAKIANFCRVVREAQAGVEWLWIDTCCIDKSSSAELSESINSMFRWYAGSECCLAFLADVGPVRTAAAAAAAADDGEMGGLEEFRGSEWFERAWTLQELVAPRVVLFFNREWEIIGYKGKMKEGIVAGLFGDCPDLTKVVEAITGIRRDVLLDYRKCRKLSLEEKEKWVLGRRTTRKEDMAYCLLGLFDIHMPLVYGEGRRAHKRLMREIREKESEVEEKRMAAQLSREQQEREEDFEMFKRWKENHDLSFSQEKQPNDRARFILDIPCPAHGEEPRCIPEQRAAGITAAFARLMGWTHSPQKAVLILASSLETQGYCHPGETIHHAFEYVNKRSLLVQEAYGQMMSMQWPHKAAIRHMTGVLCADGHKSPVAVAMIHEYLIFNPAAIPVADFPYIAPAGRPAAQVEDNTSAEHAVDTSVPRDRSDSPRANSPIIPPELFDSFLLPLEPADTIHPVGVSIVKKVWGQGVPDRTSTGRKKLPDKTPSDSTQTGLHSAELTRLQNIWLAETKLSGQGITRVRDEVTKTHGEHYPSEVSVVSETAPDSFSSFSALHLFT